MHGPNGTLAPSRLACASPSSPPLPVLSAQKELRESERDTKSGVSVSLKSMGAGSGPGADLTKLTGFVEGPRDTPYEGGYFVVDIELGEGRALWNERGD